MMPKHRTVVMALVMMLAFGHVWSKLYAQTPRNEPSIRMFVPASATTWWAALDDGGYRVVRTTDAGRRWRDLTPPGSASEGKLFLDRDTAWAWTIPGFGKPVGIAYRTTNGGRTWPSIGPLPSNNCDLHFVDLVHGWCADIGAAAGSEGVDLYRTLDGGKTWSLVSVTSLIDSSTPESIPSGCDKFIAFTSPTVGWASLVCNGAGPGDSLLYSTVNGGQTWQARYVPFPTCKFNDPANFIPSVRLDPVVVKGSWAGLRTEAYCDDRAVGISASTDGGTTWLTQSVPMQASSAALLDSAHWWFTDGTTIAATDDGGKHWQIWPLPQAMSGPPSNVSLKFLSPLLGWAVSTPEPKNTTAVWRTNDGGKTWTPSRWRVRESNHRPCMPV